MGVQYTSRADDVKTVLAELERAALKQVAKFLRTEIKNTVPVDEGVLKKNVGSWVKTLKGKSSGYKNGTPVLHIGTYSRARAKKKGYRYAYHSHLVEFGTKRMQAQPFLRPSVMNNIDQIRIIEGKFIKEIENENKALGLINVEEEIDDD